MFDKNIIKRMYVCVNEKREGGMKVKLKTGDDKKWEIKARLEV